MAALGMLTDAQPGGARPVVARSSSWIRARRAGIVRLRIGLGAHVEEGDELGEIGDALGGRPTKVRARDRGWVIGLTLNPLVNRGDALVHVAREAVGS
jgi:predicted deacylase